MEEQKKGISEDWLSLVLGTLIFILSLIVFSGVDTMGWGAKARIWTDIRKSIVPYSPSYGPVKGRITRIEGNRITVKKADGKEATVTVDDAAGLETGGTYEKEGMSPILSLILTYLFMMIIMGIGAAALRVRIGKFVLSFTIIFWLSYACWLAGHFAYIAATNAGAEGIAWSLKLTGEAGYIIALLLGLLVGNFFPGFSDFLKDATRPELYIKTAIVIMGAALGVKAAESLSLASAVMLMGLCAIVVAYLVFWALVYFVARKFFKFSREWAAPLASGISICGVSAAIATGGAIRSRPVVPIMVSSLVVIFAVVELILLPFMAQALLWKEPLVAGAWMGLAVKTDGAAVASGAVTDSLVRAKVFSETGVQYAEGWITMTATTVKIFIDIFIGVWAFILAVVWCAKIECKEGEKIRAVEIWHRFPKFVLGYVGTFAVLLVICFPSAMAIGDADKEVKALEESITSAEKETPPAGDTQDSKAAAEIETSRKEIASLQAAVAGPRLLMAKAKMATGESNIFRQIFFVLTFFTIGVVSNFRKLWEEGIGRLAAVYLLCLFGFIIWIGLAISWLFFHGMKPPVVGG
jgi:uncharacterized membrane protein YadS